MTVEKRGQRPVLACVAQSAIFALASYTAMVSSALADDQTASAGGESAHPSSDVEETSSDVEEIVVHARKRAEQAVEVPLAITALDGVQLEQQSVIRLQDLSRIAPNVSIHPSGDGGGTIQTVIRGQTTSIGYFAVDPAVGYYFDGVYVAESRGIAGGIFDLDAVEISRGVQGTLNGRNNTGGAINLFTKKPALGEFSGEASVNGGTVGTIGGDAILNIPLSDELAIRLGANSVHRGPAVHSVLDNTGYNGVGQDTGRVSLLWQPNDKLSTFATYEYSYLHQPGIALRQASDGIDVADQLAGSNTHGFDPSKTVYSLSTLIPSDFYHTAQNNTQQDRVLTQFARGTATYDVADGLTAKVIAGYRFMSSLGGLDVDGSPEVLTQAQSLGGTSKQFTVEPQLLGRAFADRLDYVVGYFHFSDRGTYFSHLAPATFFDAQGANLSDAVYGHAEYGITDRWKFAAGLRYTRDSRKVEQTSFTFGPISLYNCAFLPCALQQSYHYWSYEVSSHYDFDENWHGYVRTGLGQRSGGFSLPISNPARNPLTTVVVTTPFAPEVLTDYEIGIKATNLLNDSFGFNIDYFYGDYSNIQRLTSHLVEGSSTVIATSIINAAAAMVQGVETDFSWRATEALTLSGYGSYTDAQYSSFPYQSTAGTTDLSSEPFYQTPKWMLRLGASYDFPIGYGKLRLSGGWNWQSKTSLTLIEDPGSTQQPYSLFDARLAWTSPDGSIELAVYGTNLSDTHYFGFGQLQGKNVPSDRPTESFLVEGDPQVIAFSATYRW